MKSIELHNFKKFEFLPELQLGKVNFLVGKNNSGKSSFIRAIQTIDNIINKSRLDFVEYKFERRTIEELWGDPRYNRLICIFPLYHEDTKMTTFSNYHFDKSEDNSITVKFSDDWQPIDNSYVNVEIKIEKSNSYNSSYGEIVFFHIKDAYTGIEIELDFKKDNVKILFNPNKFDNDPRRIGLALDVFTSNLNVEKTITLSFDSLLKNMSTNYNFLMNREYNKEAGFFAILKSIDFYINGGFKSDSEERDKDEIFVTQAHKYSQFKSKMLWFRKFFNNCINPIYIPTSIIRAQNVYNICDKNDLFASIIFQYEKSQSYDFVVHWLKEFEIGESFRIDLQENQFYRIFVTGKDGIERNLAELGTGSIHLMALLLQEASILTPDDIYISSNEIRQKELKYLVLIEEPEQNLHPALQSKLADFFEYVPRTQFIVETHSEYIIRRSQVLVAKKGYKSIVETNEKSPFVVYYFPDSKDLIPYKMQYQPSGRFLLDFGEGFFDAAANISIELAKIERENRKK